MITNERQYKITKSQLLKLNKSIQDINLNNKLELSKLNRLAIAEFEALKSEAEVLESQIQEYEQLKSNSNIIFSVSDLEELPKILIQSRIAKNLSQKELATLLGLKEQQIQRYEAEDYHSASLNRLIKIAEVLNINISSVAKFQKELKTNESEPVNKFDWGKLPIVDMYKRGWFEEINLSLNEVKDNSNEILADYFSNIHKEPVLSFYRKHLRSNARFDEYALLAWECRIIHLAKKKKLIKFTASTLTDSWISDLVKLSKYPDGPKKAREKLEDAGISFIIEPMLQNTYLDGAALFYEEQPIIALTLRYDRIDNFWFVLLHEIFHVARHLKKIGLNKIFDDLDFSSTNAIEIEADKLAGEALIPKNEWDNAIARFVQSPESIKALGEKLEINPAIIAGRIRYETQNFVLLKDMIGQGKVRSLFPEIIFG